MTSTAKIRPVNRLEGFATEMLGKEAALFVASGTQSNLLGLMSHCERGEEYIVGQQAHTYKYEGGGRCRARQHSAAAARLRSGRYTQPGSRRGRDQARRFPFRAHAPAVPGEHQGGKALPLDYLQRAHEFARARRLSLHLDGARVFNAAIKHGVHVSEIARWFDTVSVCLSKGLGAPVGSVLCGSGELIARARRWRKVLGGGMRQAGVLAAAGLYALEHNVARLAEDHVNAATLAQRVADLPGINAEHGPTQTNMVFMRVAPADLEPLRQFLKQRGILIGNGNPVRLVTHLDISAADVGTVVDALSAFFAQGHGDAQRCGLTGFLLCARVFSKRTGL
jgi:threonine aldolase